MRLQDLERHGIPMRLIERWAERQGDTLLPVQNRAIRKGLLGRSGDDDGGPVRLLVSAPTASGKSFCAELAIARALARRQKAVMLVPLKALAEQKHRTFRESFGSLGVRCLIATGDHPENDSLLADGDYQVAVAIYEKLDLLLTSHLDLLQTIGLLVVDEIQTIAEPGRGAVLERLLTRVLASKYEPSLLGLSAVIGESSAAAGRLADWLGATLVEESSRPVDLMRGVAADGRFRYRSFNSGLEGDEPFMASEIGDDPFDQFVEQLREESGATLVFLKSRRETVDRAIRLAASVGWPPADEAIELLAEEEPSFLIRTLRQALSRGVAFHNADLSSRQRRIVEDAFARQKVRVVFATTTLAMGVDLPADTVYLETVKYAGGAYDSRPTLVPVSRAEFDNMTGRAGRLGHGAAPQGKAIVLAESEFDREVLWKAYIAAEDVEPIRSVFDSMPLTDWVLNMIASGLAGSIEDLKRIYRRTLHAATLEQAPEFGLALERLRATGLIRNVTDDALELAPLGEAASQTGLSVEQVEYFRQAFEHRFPESWFGWTVLALGAPGWNPPAGMLSRYEAVQQLPLKLLLREYDYLIEEARPLVGDALAGEPLDYGRSAALKGALVLTDWRGMTPVERVEERFQMHLGQVMTLGENVAHLIASAARLVEATDRETGVGGQLRDLAFAVRFGLDPALREMYRLVGDILTRSDLAALHRAGLTTLEGLLGLTDEDLAEHVLGRNKLLKMSEKIVLLKQEVDMPQVNVASERSSQMATPMSVRPVSIEIDGSYERERYLIRINGFPVRLTGKSFKYFARLAWARVHRDSGWMYKEDIETGFNQARYLYRMKNEVNDGLSTAWSVVENNRLGYYRLNVDPGCIKFNIEQMRHHPDFEVRSLVGGQNRQAVN